MKYHDRDRLFFSILIASVIYALIWGFLELSGWENWKTPPREYGPLFVQLAPQPDLAPAEPDREVDAPRPEEAEPEEAEQADTTETEAAPSREVSPPDREAPPPDRETSAPSVAPAETVPSSPVESEPVPRIAQAEQSSQGAPEETPAPSPEPSPTPVTAPDPEVDADASDGDTVIEDTAPVLPAPEETEEDSWGETRFVYDDDDEPAADSVPEEADSSSETETSDESLFDTSALDNLLSDLPDQGDSESENGDSSGTSESSSVQDETVSEEQQIRDDIIYDLQDLESKRQLLFSPEPEVPSDFNSEGRTQFEVVVSFILQPDGFLKDLNIVQSSGYSEVDTAVQIAMRKWKFEPVPGYRESGSDGITVTLRYVYGVK